MLKRVALVTGVIAVGAMSASGPAIAANDHRTGWKYADARLDCKPAITTKRATRLFLRAAAQSNRFEILKSELALERAESPKIKTIAELLIRDHTAELERIEAFAESFGVRLPRKLNRLQRRQLALLGELSGAKFDRAYLRIQTLAHLQAIFVYRFGATFARQPVREHARATLPVLRHHLELVTAARADG